MSPLVRYHVLTFALAAAANIAVIVHAPAASKATATRSIANPVARAQQIVMAAAISGPHRPACRAVNR